MAKLKKISPETNVVTWFEIPVQDSQRSRAFLRNDTGYTNEHTVYTGDERRAHILSV